MHMLSMWPWRGNTGMLTTRKMTVSVCMGLFVGHDTHSATWNSVFEPHMLVTELKRETHSLPSQWPLSVSTTVIIANHLCRCFYAENPALPLVLDDVICKCCEGNSDVMCFYFFFLGSTWTEKGDSTDHWTSLLESMNNSSCYLMSLTS